MPSAFIFFNATEAINFGQVSPNLDAPTELNTSAK